jgi:hypothetical protein
VRDASNPCPNELSYVKTLRKTMELYGFKDQHFIVDTSRNGKAQIRKKAGTWCNLAGAGLAFRPTRVYANASTAFGSAPLT